MNISSRVQCKASLSEPVNANFLNKILHVLSSLLSLQGKQFGMLLVSKEKGGQVWPKAGNMK